MAGGGGGLQPSGSRRAVVVVVGGGVAGALLANSLQNHAEVILIDPKMYRCQCTFECLLDMTAIGAGLSGVELATEIAVNYPDKKVTLVHDRPRLLESIGQKAGGKAPRWLRSKNVEFLLDQSVDLESMSAGDMLYRTSSGVEITADFYFSCLDSPLSSSWIRDSEMRDCLDSDGRLMVDANLRLKGQSNMLT